MRTNNERVPSRRRAGAPPAFTLVELLVAMAVIAILGTITVVAVKKLSNGARLSSGTNTVVSALGTARSLAMRDNKLVLVAFRPRSSSPTSQYVEVVFCEWTGETYGPDYPIVDRFTPIQDQPIRRLPEGVKVAAPLFGADDDDVWVTQLQLSALDEAEQYQELSGVMYGPDGATRSRNADSDSNGLWIDFDDDLQLRFDGEVVDPQSTDLGAMFGAERFIQHREYDEPMVNIAPFIAVYDDDEARQFGTPTYWTNGVPYYSQLVGPDGYITQYADRIHFNRYTGVVTR